jgi:hypothetical protein
MWRVLRAGAVQPVLALALVAAAPTSSPGVPEAVRVAPARVAHSDASGVTFRVEVRAHRLSPSGAIEGAERLDIDGFERTGSPGEPPVYSRQFLVGLPPQGSFTVSHRIVATAALGRHRLEPFPAQVRMDDEELGPVPAERVTWDEAVYRAAVAPPALTADEPAYIRHQRVLPVRVNPVLYDPVSEELSLATIEIEVRFQGGGAPTPAVPARESKDWEETFARLLVNAPQAKAWRVPPAAVPSLSPALPVAVVPGAVKIRVRETGMHAVTASALVSAGFPAGQPLSNLHLFRRAYEEATLTASTQTVAHRVQEDAGGTPGVFDGNDRLVFYGRRLRDDAAQGDTREQFSAYNVYWLEPAPGAAMTEAFPGPGFVTADTSAASFPVTAAHFETDLVFREGTPPGISDIYYYNFGGEPGPVDMPFEMNAVRPGTNVTLSAELHGQTYESPRTIRVSMVGAAGETVLDGAYAVSGKIRRTFSAAVPAASFLAGTNQFRISRPDNSRTSVQVLVNFVEATYQSLYRARGNALRFNSASLAGDTTITVTGITNSSDLELYDVTDPVLPRRLVLDAGHFQPADGGTALSFRQSYTGRREFLLVRASRMITVASGDLAADAPSAIIGGAAENGVDVLVVSHAQFIPTMRAWVSYRRSQGYRVSMVDVEDVFDEFNGGVPSARAVYRFARHFFLRGDAGALVLVGDASEDHKRVHDDSGPNFVPTFTRIDNVSSLQIDEVVTTDKRLVKFPGAGGTVDVYPDMIIGRLPAGETGELEIMLNKVYAFEAPSASDFWRKRMIIVADDEYSEGSSTFGGFQFCDNNEAAFEAGQENAAQVIERSLPAGYDVVRFYLRTYTDDFYTTQCANRFAAISYTRQNATEPLINELGQGATLVWIQSHMNRSVVTHERLLTTQPASILGGSTGRDHLRSENRGKPWVMFALGCHFSEYAIHREFNDARTQDNAPNGDAFGEQYLFQNERGAVGTFGSSGFEYLNQTNAFMNVTAAVWFYDAPYDTMVNQTQAEWQFGQLMFLVESQIAGSQRDPVERYHILGDPLLRIDAGPPAFEVTVNGVPARSGDVVESGGEGDTLRVVAVVTDENAIRDFKLEIAGADLSDSLAIEPLVDAQLPRARQYRVSFRHKVRPETYDIVLRAYQAPDTLAGAYHMVAEFLLKVESSISVSVNGRAVESGGLVPAEGKYRVDLSFPVFVPTSDVAVTVDDRVPGNLSVFRPDAEDSLAIAATFRETLAPGRHELRVTAGTIDLEYILIVSENPGLRDLVNYPNPFRGEGTSFVYSNEVEILDGTIDIFTVSGKRVRRLEIPLNARQPGQNSIYWDGRDSGGGELANGVYLYVVRATQRGGSITERGKMSKVE